MNILDVLPAVFQTPPSGPDPPVEETMNLTEILIRIFLKGRGVFSEIWNHDYSLLDKNIPLTEISFVDIIGVVLGIVIVVRVIMSVIKMFGKLGEMLFKKIFDILAQKALKLSGKILKRAFATLKYIWNSKAVWNLRRRILFKYERVLYDIQERQKLEL